MKCFKIRKTKIQPLLFYIQIYLLIEIIYVIYQILMYSLIYIFKSHFSIILVYFIRKNHSTELFRIFRGTPCPNDHAKFRDTEEKFRACPNAALGERRLGEPFSATVHLSD